MKRDLLSQSIILKDGRRFGFAEYGDLKGKPLFFFHGWPCSRYHASVTHTAALKLHLRVISVDRPGFGLSDFKLNRNLISFSDDIIELADQIGIKKFSIVGVSGGGPYAAVCGYKLFNRLDKVGIVVGLSPIKKGLLDGTSLIAKFCWSNYRRFPILRTTGSLFQLVISRYSPGIGIHRFLWGARADKQIYDKKEVRENAQKNYREAFRQGYKGPELDLKIFTEEWGFDITKIKTPVYLWYGADDKNVSVKMGEYYHSQIKNSKLTIYQNEGHLISRTHIEDILSAFI